MNTAEQTDAMIAEWSKQALSRSDMTVKVAQACLGWPYVYAEAGAEDTPAKRRARANALDSSKPDEAAEIRKKCQVLSNKKLNCAGCKWFPDGKTVRCFDCRGFTRWVLSKVGISMAGGGATSQWNTAANWKAKGTIDEMPSDQVCVLFWKDKQKSGVMAHTGLHIGGGQIIHCSGEVKRDTTATKGWTHYAIPVGMEGDVPVSRQTIRKGSSGDLVVELQKALLQLGYDVGSSGADRKFGRMTETAVKAFQSNSGLTSDGICGPATWAAIDKAVGGATQDTAAKTTLYTVTIRHLTQYDAEALKARYDGAVTIEGE